MEPDFNLKTLNVLNLNNFDTGGCLKNFTESLITAIDEILKDVDYT
jgi:hypothetical protein